MSRIDVKKQKE